MDTICINCPMGCPLHIEEVNGEIVVTGNTCKRGETYGKAEYTMPVRMVTSLVKLQNGVTTSVRTSKPVPKKMIFDVLKEIKKLRPENDVKCEDVVATNIANSGADVIITGNL